VPAPGAQEVIALDINGEEPSRRAIKPTERSLPLTSDNGAVSTLFVN